MVASQKRKETAIKYEAQDFHMGFHTMEELNCLHMLIIIILFDIFMHPAVCEVFSCIFSFSTFNIKDISGLQDGFCFLLFVKLQLEVCSLPGSQQWRFQPGSSEVFATVLKIYSELFRSKLQRPFITKSTFLLT